MLAASLLSLMAAQVLQPDAVVIVGQSLANGSASTAANTEPTGTSTVFSANLPVTAGVCGAVGGPVSRTSLSEIVPSSVSYIVEGAGLNQQPPRFTVASAFYAVTGRGLTVLQSSCGGGSYAAMKKGNTAFRWVEHLLEAYGSRATGERVIASIAIHGEQDRNLGTPTATYKANLLEWQADIEAKARGVTETGASAPVPMLINQTSGSCAGVASTNILAAQWQAFRDNPTRVILVQPTYPLVHNADDVHLVGASYQTLGAQFGKVVAVLRAGGSWRPVYPTSITLDGAVLTATFHATVPPLVVDTALVATAAANGFAYHCGSSPPAISSVDCSEMCAGNACACRITLESPPSVQCQTTDVLRYAWPTSSCVDPGPLLGARGNIRDSDPAGYNWLVHFEEAVQ